VDLHSGMKSTVDPRFPVFGCAIASMRVMGILGVHVPRTTSVNEVGRTSVQAQINCMLVEQREYECSSNLGSISYHQ
jgi:hypothetical protein